MARINKHLTADGLEEPFSSSPVRPPRFTLVMTRIGDDAGCFDPNGTRRLWTWAFYADYAARRALDFLISDRDTRWIDDNTLIIGEKLKVTSSRLPAGLSDILEHEFTTQERAWELPSDYYRIGASMFVDREPEWFDKPVADDKPSRTKPTKPEKPAPTPRPSKEGLVDLPAVIAQVSPPIDAKEARGILRKHATKPAEGWAWPKSEVAGIVALLKEKRK